MCVHATQCNEVLPSSADGEGLQPSASEDREEAQHAQNVATNYIKQNKQIGRLRVPSIYATRKCGTAFVSSSTRDKFNPIS